MAVTDSEPFPFFYIVTLFCYCCVTLYEVMIVLRVHGRACAVSEK